MIRAMALSTLLILVLPWLSSPAVADPVQAKHAIIELISPIKAISPGAEFNLGIFFDLDDGWHIYWENPGDSGEPPRIKWTLPDGVDAGPISWPFPKRIPFAHLVNLGYEDEVLLMVPMKASETLRVGQPITFRADLRYLICREVCIPGKADLEITLPVNKTPSTDTTHWRGLFDLTRTRIPRPVPSSWQVSAEDYSDQLKLTVQGTESMTRVEFFPSQSEVIALDPPPLLEMLDQGYRLTLKKSDHAPQALTQLQGVLVHDGKLATRISAPVTRAVGGSVWTMLFFAFIGGLILNLMPCVFPVLSIKVLGFLKHSEESAARVRAHGFAYAGGILVSFWILVGVLLLLRSGGHQVGWGFQLQSPAFIGVLACGLFFFGLNLAGLFEFQATVPGNLQKLMFRDGYSGAFFSGVLATILATPCTAPFMGTAIGFAMAESSLMMFTIFSVLGLGLSSPYLLLSFRPGLARFLPRPGRWMETLKQFLAFPIFATVIWLIWVLGAQVGTPGISRILLAILGVGFFSWLLGRWHLVRPMVWFGALGVIASTVYGAVSVAELRGTGLKAYDETARIQWEPFSQARILELRKQNKAVFLDFTAAWCVTCQVNETLVFGSEEVLRKIEELEVVMMKADWTNYDPEITRTITGFGRSGIPLYVLYPRDPKSAPILLPEIITADLVLKELDKLK